MKSSHRVALRTVLFASTLVVGLGVGYFAGSFTTTHTLSDKFALQEIGMTLNNLTYDASQSVAFRNQNISLARLSLAIYMCSSYGSLNKVQKWTARSYIKKYNTIASTATGHALLPINDEETPEKTIRGEYCKLIS